MTDADSKRYDIYFAGECLEGHAEPQVRAAIGKLFKADGHTLEQLFSGQRQRIKRDCDQATALRYQKAMAAAGARAIVTNASAPTVPLGETASRAQAPASDQAPEPAPTPAQTPTGGPMGAPQAASPAAQPAAMSLAPVGSDVLRPEERATTDAAPIDVEHLSVADAGEDLSTEPVVQISSIEAPHLEVADVGVDLDQTPPTEPAAVPDTSTIHLAPADYDLSDCAPPAAQAPLVDIDALSIAETGTDLLSASERQKPQTDAPDTSHLTLDPANDP